MIVNKRETARLLGCTVPTLDAWLRRYSDLPVVRRGDRCRPWQFDAEAVRAWQSARQEAALVRRRDRADQLAQLALPLIVGQLVPAAAAGGDIEALIAAAKLRRLQLDEARHAGELVAVAPLRIVLADALGRLGRGLRASLRRIVSEHGIPADCAARIEAAFAADQRQAVEAISAAIGEAVPAPEERARPALRLVAG